MLDSDFETSLNYDQEENIHLSFNEDPRKQQAINSFTMKTNKSTKGTFNSTLKFQIVKNAPMTPKSTQMPKKHFSRTNRHSKTTD